MIPALSLGFTPDPDDAFEYCALVHGIVQPRGWELANVRPAPIEELNEAARGLDLDIAAVSSAFYPFIADDYAVLRSGASVGRSYGPALAARPGVSLDDLAGHVVAVPGETTTGAALLRLFHPEVETRVMPFAHIRRAIADGEVTAGVLIHEELLSFAESGLVRLECLGERWAQETGLPLPVGLNVVRRDLGDEVCRDVCRCVAESIVWALEHPERALRFAKTFGRGPDSPVGDRFVRMFANTDTVSLATDVEQGLEELLRRLERARLTPAAGPVRLVEPSRLGPALPSLVGGEG